MRFLACVFVCITFSCMGQEWLVTRYSQTNGLPQNSVNALYWDMQNMLWISTDDGLVRFDGNRFSVLKDTVRTGLHADRFRWIIPYDDKSCVVASSSGTVYHISENRITPLMKRTALRRFQTDMIGLKDMEWLLSKDLEKEMRKHAWLNFPIRMLKVEDELWVLGKAHFLKYKDGRLRDSIPLHPNVRSMYRVGGSVVFCYQSEVRIWNQQRGKEDELSFDKKYQFASKHKWFQQPFSNDIFFIGNDSIFNVTYQNQSLKSTFLCRLPEGESEATLSGIAYNKKLNRIAIGTMSNGLFIHKKAQFENKTGAKSSQYAQNKLNDSSILGTFGHVFTNAKVAVSHSYNMTEINSQYFHIDGKGTLWAFKNDSLLKQPKGLPRQSFYCSPAYRIMALFGSADTVYIVTPTALLKIKDNDVDTVIYRGSFGESGQLLSVLLRGDSLYLGAEDALYMLTMRNGQVQKRAEQRNVWMLSALGRDVIGSALNQGLFVFSNDSLKLLPPDPHHYLRKAHQLYQSSNGDVFVSTNNGLLQTHSSWIYDYINNRRTDIPWKYYTDADGLDNVEFNGGCTPGVVELGKGIVSMSNMGGLVWFQPGKIAQQYEETPRVYIAECAVDERMVEIRDSVRIAPAGEHLSIQMGSIYWGNPLDIEVEYCLEGYMSEFRKLNSISYPISFTQLPAGTYRLVIRCNAGIGDNRLDKLVLVIVKEPRFVETWWFYLVMFLLLLAAVFGGVTVYNRRLVRQNRLLEEKIGLRTHELQRSNVNLQTTQKELLESISVKSKLITIIAHDIITPLRFIAKVSKNFRSSAAPDEKAGNEMMEEIHHTSQRLYDNAQNVLNWIRYQNNLISVKKVPVVPFVTGDEIAELFTDVASQRNNTITNRIEMEDVIETDKTILSIIIHNLVANAVKYTRDASIEILSRHYGANYIITVKDNGAGISPQSMSRIENLRKGIRTQIFNDVMEGTGLGYIIIFELAGLIEAQIEINSVPGEGTQVHIILPSMEEEDF